MSFDTSKARAEILQRIRSAQKRGAPSAGDLSSADGYLASHPAGPRPAPYADRLAHFRAKFGSIGELRREGLLQHAVAEVTGAAP